MNYTSAIRKYCQRRIGSIIDAPFVYREYFPLMEYRTFLKVLNRLEKDGMPQPIDKGVYYIRGNGPQTSPEKLSALIITYYTANYHGIWLGDERIYTNRLPSGKKKHVADHLLIGAELFYDRTVEYIISALELIEHRGNAGVVQAKQLLRNYQDEEIVPILSAIEYSRNTIATLNQILDELHIAHDRLKRLTLPRAKL